MVGAAVCFWLASIFTQREKVSKKDLVLLLFASLLSIVFNQGLFIFGLSLTSPVDASIITTSLPIITLILAALFMKEPITLSKAGGVLIGTVGAVILVLSNHNGTIGAGNVLGDILCLTAQISFACYLTIFKRLISRYNVVTLMKWMFTYASICFIPLSFNDILKLFQDPISTSAWFASGYVIIFGTFFAYMLVLIGQKKLKPTIVSMYNYVQPIVGTGVSILIGMGTFGWIKALASILIFIGVYIVTRNTSNKACIK